MKITNILTTIVLILALASCLIAYDTNNIVSEQDARLGSITTTFTEDDTGAEVLANLLSLITEANNSFYADQDVADYINASSTMPVDEWNTAYSWGDHAGLYDALGQATNTLSVHTSAYDHDSFLTSTLSDNLNLNSNNITGTGNIYIQGDIKATSTNGIDINPGSDTNADLITVGVTGSPKMYWSESQDRFIFTNDIYLDGNDISVSTGNFLSISTESLTVGDVPSFSAASIADLYYTTSAIESATVDELLVFSDAGSSAVNEINISNATTTNNPILSSSGSDTNIGLTLGTKGTGLISFYGDYTFPQSDGTTNYVLKTNGSGTLSWAEDSTGTGWTFATTTLDYWFDNTAGITRLDNYLLKSDFFSTTTMPNLNITESQISDFGSYLPLSGGVLTGSSTLIGDFTVIGNTNLQDTYIADGSWLIMNGNNAISLTDNNFYIGASNEEILKFTDVASAVNEFTISNASTGNNPTLSVTGGDTNIGLTINGKGTGLINMYGNYNLPIADGGNGTALVTNGSGDLSFIDVWTEAENTAANYATQAYASSTYAIAGGAYHDGFSDFVANEHIDWTQASAGTIHATNYVDNNTTYTGGDHLTLTGTDFDVDDDFLSNTGDTGTGDYNLSAGTTTLSVITSDGGMDIIFDWAGTTTPNICIGACY